MGIQPMTHSRLNVVQLLLFSWVCHQAASQSITNLPNTVVFEEEKAGTIMTVEADSTGGTWAIAEPTGETCNAILDTATCTTTSDKCKVEYTAASQANFEDAEDEVCKITVGTDTKTLTIDVTNKDDVEPDTICDVTTVDVDENDETIQGVLIATCSSTTVTGFTIFYDLEVDPVSEEPNFVIDSATGEVRWASVTLDNDHEEVDTITLTVTARTALQTDATPVDITVTINDVNETPVITNLPQTLYIDENFPRYSTTTTADVDLLLLVVYDQDDGHTQVAEIVSATCNLEAWFQIKPSGTGGDELQVATLAAADFDYEDTACREIDIELRVVDDGTPALTSDIQVLTLIVLNKDEVPWFNEGNPAANGVGTAYEDTVDYPNRDAPFTTSGRFFFSEATPAGYQFKDVDSSGTAITRATRDGIYIADLSDYLEARQYYDPDCSPDDTCMDKATFQITSTGLLESYFEIREDGSTDKYYLYLVAKIDYEIFCEAENWNDNSFEFTMNILGVDDTGLETTNSIDLFMSFYDINEFIPVMGTEFQFSLAENSPFDTQVGTEIICQSLYECHADAINRFYIQGGRPTTNDGRYYFYVPTQTVGIINVLRPIDYEMIQQVVFEFDCRDYNTIEAAYKTATATVTVDIIDQNDNEPAFNQTFYSLAIRFDAEYRSYITTLYAFDADAGLNAVPVYQLGAYSKEFGIDAATGDVYTTAKRLIPFHSYIIYGIVYDTGEPGQAQNIGSNVATIRIDTYDASYVMVDLYLGISWEDYNATSLVEALDNLMQPYKFFVYENTGGVNHENRVVNGVKVSVYAIENSDTLDSAHLTEDKIFVPKTTLLEVFREYYDGTPSELFQSPQIIDFKVRYVEPTPISSNFYIKEDASNDSWMIDEPEGNVVLAAVILFTVLVLLAILYAIYKFMRNANCWRPSQPEPRQYDVSDNKLMVGKLNTNSVTALARNQNGVVNNATPPKAVTPPAKPQIVPVIPTVNVEPRPPLTGSRSGRKIWEVRKPTDLADAALN